MFSGNGLAAQAPAYAGGGLVPSSNYGSGFGSSVPAGLTSLFSGMFSDAGSPYSAAMGPYQQYMGQATGQLNPFVQAGQGAMGNYQQWLKSQQDPSGFINNLMGQYHQSPMAQYEQQQAMRAAQNMGSASGLTGSTPLMLQAQQNASNISSGDMQNWLGNVLGINTQYGQGEANLMNQGYNAANSLANLYGQQAQGMSQLAYGQQMGENQNMGNIFGGLASLL